MEGTLMEGYSHWQKKRFFRRWAIEPALCISLLSIAP